MITEPLAAPHAQKPITLFLGYQRQWSGDSAAVKVWEKSRRIGASWGEAGDSALLAASASGMNVFYVGYTLDMAKDFIKDCAEFAQSYQLAAGDISEEEEVWYEGNEKKSVRIFTINFASGHRIEALSSAPRNLRAKQGRIILDEFAFHSAPAELLKAALAMLIWGGQVHVISTHNGTENAFNQLVLDVRAGKVPYSLHRTTFMDAVDDGLYERVCLRTGETPSAEGKAAWIAWIYAQYGADAAEELDVIPKSGEGTWLSRALIEARMVKGRPVLKWAPPEDGFMLWSDEQRTAEMREWLDREVGPLLDALDVDLESGFGEDFGRTGDLTVITPYQVESDLTRSFPFAVELRNCPFDQQREAVFYIGDRLPRFRACKLDARGNGQYLAEKCVQRWAPRGVDVEAVMLSVGWYRDNTAPFKAAFEDGTISLPASAEHLDDLRAIVMVKGVPSIPDVRTTATDGKKRHADAAVAYLMAYAASRSEVMPPSCGSASPAPDTYSPNAAKKRGSGMFGQVDRETGEARRRGVFVRRGAR